jgi:hypothetical protein
MNNESKQASTHLSKEFVFWFHVIRRKLAYYFPWDTPQQLVRVIVSNSHVRSDGVIWTNSQDILNISLQDIVQTKLAISTGHIGTLEIITQESQHYVLLPTNPFDPTLLSHSNVDEVLAFMNVVEALKANRPPDFDENPYRRQFQKNNQPAYLDSKIDLFWDRVERAEYYDSARLVRDFCSICMVTWQ